MMGSLRADHSYDELFMAMIPPDQGYGVVAVTKILECGIDESDTGKKDGKDGKDGHLILSTYAFRPEALAGFNRKWCRALKDLDLSAFHMTDCMAMNPRKPNEFSGWSKVKRVKAARRFIKIIHNTALFGACLSVDKRAYWGEPGALIRHWSGAFGSLYAFGVAECCWYLSYVKQRYADLRDAKYLCYVEKGYEQGFGPAERTMRLIEDDANLKEDYSLFHTNWVPKGSIRSNEAADMLAWLWMKKGQGIGNPEMPEMPRKELAIELTTSSLRVKHFRRHIGPEGLKVRTMQIGSSSWSQHLSSR
jgi:hypothetical protein